MISCGCLQVSSHDLLELSFNERDPDNLHIGIKNPENGSRRVSMRLLNDTEGSLTDMPEVDYSMILTMPSQDLQRNVKEMLPNGETIRITCGADAQTGERKVTFTTTGDAGDIACDLPLDMDRMEVEQFEDIDMSFSLKYLWSFVKAAPLSPQVKIYLKQGMPISLKYEMGSHGKHSLGEAIFLMAPKVEDDIFFPEPDPEPKLESEAPVVLESKPEPPPAKRRKTASGNKPKKAAQLANSPPASPQDSPVSAGRAGAWHEDDPADDERACLEWD